MSDALAFALSALGFVAITEGILLYHLALMEGVLAIMGLMGVQQLWRQFFSGYQPQSSGEKTETHTP